MKAESNELFHLAVLRVLETNRTRFGLGIVAISHHLALFGFTAGNCGGAEKFFERIADTLEYLVNKQCAEEVAKQMDKANRAWRITADGISYVDERG
jgi:hypothetical protein